MDPATRTTVSSSLLDMLDEFTSEQQEQILSRVQAVELNVGCTGGCDFCGLDAPKGIKATIPFDTLVKLAEKISVARTDRTPINLYFASDPLDYQDGQHHYFDVLEVFTANNIPVITSTIIPKGKEELAVAHLSSIDRISISHVNRNRLMPYFDRLGIGIYACDENFFNALSRVADPQYGISDDDLSVEDYTPVPVGEASHHFFDMRLKQIDECGFFQKGEAFLFCAPTFRKEEVEKFMAVREARQQYENPLPRSSILFDYLHREKVADRDLDHYLGCLAEAGRNFKGGYRRNGGISPHEGTLITPEGFFNLYCTDVDAQNQTGNVIEGINPQHFRVVDYLSRLFECD